jgi:quinol monooxygenase YgiN
MLVRLVRMTFRPDAVSTFLAHFDDAAPKIRSFAGCQHLELWRDAHDSGVFTTHSHWTQAEALDAYRDSDLFRETWSSVKPLFAERPQAHSYTVHRAAEPISTEAEQASDG